MRASKFTQQQSALLDAALAYWHLIRQDIDYVQDYRHLDLLKINADSAPTASKDRCIREYFESWSSFRTKWKIALPLKPTLSPTRSDFDKSIRSSSREWRFLRSFTLAGHGLPPPKHRSREPKGCKLGTKLAVMVAVYVDVVILKHSMRGAERKFKLGRGTVANYIAKFKILDQNEQASLLDQYRLNKPLESTYVDALDKWRIPYQDSRSCLDNKRRKSPCDDE